MRPIDRDLIRGGHYGQRPRVPHFKGRTHGCTDQCCKREESSCQLGAVHTWHIASFAASQHFVRYWTRANIEQPLLELCFRSFDLVVDDPSRFLKGLGWRWAWHRCGQPQPIFVVYRYDETGLASEIEPVEIVRLGFEDHSLRSHSALKRLVPKSGVLPPDTFF